MLFQNSIRKGGLPLDRQNRNTFRSRAHPRASLSAQHGRLRASGLCGYRRDQPPDGVLLLSNAPARGSLCRYARSPLPLRDFRHLRPVAPSAPEQRQQLSAARPAPLLAHPRGRSAPLLRGHLFADLRTNCQRRRPALSCPSKANGRIRPFSLRLSDMPSAIFP